MSWQKRFKKDMDEKQKEAEKAVVQAEISLLDAMNIQFNSERIARGLEKMQSENHFGFRLFGVE